MCEPWDHCDRPAADVFLSPRDLLLYTEAGIFCLQLCLLRAGVRESRPVSSLGCWLVYTTLHLHLIAQAAAVRTSLSCVAHLVLPSCTPVGASKALALESSLASLSSPSPSSLASRRSATYGTCSGHFKDARPGPAR